MKTFLALLLGAHLALAALPALALDEPAPQAPAPAAAAPRGSDTPAPRAPKPADGQSQLFSVALVQADNSNSPSGPLPPAFEKALSDVRAFLPYKSFRLLDSGLTRTRREGSLFLRGDRGREFRAQMVLYPSEEGGVPSFVFENFRLESRVNPDPQGTATDSATPKPTALLTASFRVDRGETVIVGSAKLESTDGAIIVLLTAVP